MYWVITASGTCVGISTGQGGSHGTNIKVVCFFSSCSPPPVLAVLHNAGLVATDERERLSDISDVVRVQRGKSPAKVAKAADILKAHGFEEQSVFLSGEWA